MIISNNDIVTVVLLNIKGGRGPAWGVEVTFWLILVTKEQDVTKHSNIGSNMRREGGGGSLMLPQ